MPYLSSLSVRRKGGRRREFQGCLRGAGSPGDEDVFEPGLISAIQFLQFLCQPFISIRSPFSFLLP